MLSDARLSEIGDALTDDDVDTLDLLSDLRQLRDAVRNVPRANGCCMFCSALNGHEPNCVKLALEAK